MNARKWQWRPHASGSISLCMIMKNESKVLERCLTGVRGLVSEIIIADTGSTDNSIKLAESLGAKVFSIPWTDDFAAARNAAIERATSDWILILDPDEVLSIKDHDKIRQYTSDTRFSAYRIHTRNYSHDGRQQGALPNTNDYPEGAGYPVYIISTKTRLFRASCGIRFRGVWHELLDWDIESNKIPVASVEVPVHHYPHEICQESYKAKALFYNRLGKKRSSNGPTIHKAGTNCLFLIWSSRITNKPPTAQPRPLNWAFLLRADSFRRQGPSTNSVQRILASSLSRKAFVCYILI